MNYLVKNDITKVSGGQTSCTGSSDTNTVTCQTTIHQGKNTELSYTTTTNTNTGRTVGGGVTIKVGFN